MADQIVTSGPTSENRTGSTGYDIIGDVHGCASMLEERLLDMGYRRNSGHGAYRHPMRQAVFVGDLIDRGPQQRETLELVKAMVDAGNAQIVMGNHEFNAITYAMQYPEPGAFLRQHTKKNAHQHQAFLDQLTDSQRKYYVEWFKTFPLWLDLGGIRIVHACWHEESIQVFRDKCGGDRFTNDKQFARATDKRSKLYHAVEVLLKGPEIDLRRYSLDDFRDKDGAPRHHARLCWWKEGETKLSELTELNRFKDARGRAYPPPVGREVKGRDQTFVYRAKVPVFYGHYWRLDTPAHLDDFTDHTACVDFSAVNHDKGGGTLVAYRWNHGEKNTQKIDEDQYEPHGSARRARPLKPAPVKGAE